MGFVVCHIEKPKGNDAGTSSHIERKVHPANADQSREHLNQKLIEYPDGVENRTQAIQHRIETAGITRKIGTNHERFQDTYAEAHLERDHKRPGTFNQSQSFSSSGRKSRSF